MGAVIEMGSGGKVEGTRDVDFSGRRDDAF